MLCECVTCFTSLMIAGNIVLVQNPRSLTPMIGNITTGQSQTELLKQQREQLAQEKAKEWKIPQWVEDEERERRKKKLKSKNRKIEETKNQKTKKLPEAQEEIKVRSMDHGTLECNTLILSEIDCCPEKAFCAWVLSCIVSFG